MRVVVAGGSGFLGSALVRSLVDRGHEVTVLTRSVRQAAPSLPAGARAVEWGAGTGWYRAVDGADAVVNLAGESIGNGRWSPARKQRILSTRVETTRAVVAAISRAGRRPGVLVNASAVGYYGPRGTEEVTEADPPGSDFMSMVCREWELAAAPARLLGVRVVHPRTGVVLGLGGGAFPRMLLPFRLFLGGPLGNGRQPFPWVHLDDAVGLLEFALFNPAVQGPINVVAPEKHTNRSFCQTLGRVMGRPCWAPVPGFVLRLGLGEMAGPLLLQGQQAVPAAALRLGYAFKHPELVGALRAVLGR